MISVEIHEDNFRNDVRGNKILNRSQVSKFITTMENVQEKNKKGLLHTFYHQRRTPDYNVLESKQNAISPKRKIGKTLQFN